ncbi:hypothetical protein QTH91_19475 [Variovorax dokdonensis]|uniref:Uncharacterized protein n=1 Tax=Variovorax dokdonensis TaxID=344883 RepID=A0ABT7NFE9_9BURK|nr:hypothetical protein [Variovorax dokdonensis]MDM0046680.1 hypothetical protein [Variovorax dokdonensis]
MVRAIFILLSASVSVGLWLTFGAWVLFGLFALSLATLLFSTRHQPDPVMRDDESMAEPRTTAMAPF